MSKGDLDGARRKKATGASLCAITPARRVRARAEKMVPVLITRLLAQIIEPIHVKFVRLLPQFWGTIDSLRIHADNGTSRDGRSDREFDWLLCVAL